MARLEYWELKREEEEAKRASEQNLMLEKQKKEELMSKLDDYRKRNPKLTSMLAEREAAINLIIEIKEKIGTVNERNEKTSEILTAQSALQTHRKKFKEIVAKLGCEDFFDGNFSNFNKDSKFKEALLKYLSETGKSMSYGEEDTLNHLFDLTVNDRNLLSDEDIYAEELSDLSKKEKNWVEFKNKISENKFRDFIHNQLV